MENVRAKLIKPIRSRNGLFEVNFNFYSEIPNSGIVHFTSLNSKKLLEKEFVIDAVDGKEMLTIKNILVKRADRSGFDGAINKSVDDVIHFLKYGVSDFYD